MLIQEEIQFFYRVLSAIRFNLTDFVLVGGFASYLYQFHDRSKPTDLSPLLTYDIDLASAEKISIRGGKSVHQSLSEIGLEQEFTGNCTPPLVKYFPKGRKPSMYVEFLTPLRGSETKQGVPDITQNIQRDLSAQKLRFLDLLLKGPWKMSTSSVPAFIKRPKLVVRIPHPGMFIMQKILISERRTGRSRPKDFAYIYQTLSYLREDLEAIAKEYKILIDNPEWKKWYRRFIRLSKEIFGTSEGEGPVGASEILARATPEMIFAVVNRFIDSCPKI
jgi:hypothetical protein